MSFVHLHTHTEYSFLDGACRIGPLVKRAKELNMNALAITDHGDMCGVIEFYKEAKAAGIKPLIGCEVYVAAKDRNIKTHDNGNTTHHLVLIAKNMTGYRNLIKVVSAGFIDGFYYKPRVDFSVLKQHAEGLICLSACLAGEIPQAIVNGDEERAKKLIAQYSSLYGKENFFLEIQNHGIADQRRVNAFLIPYAQEAGIGLVATNDVHYIEKKDAKYQDLLMCIQTNRKVAETDRMAFETDEFYLKSEEEMNALFGQVPGALSNTQKIADMCDLEFEFGVLKLPKFAVPNSGDAFDYLKSLCYEGLHKRYGEKANEVKERLDFELEVIRSMGYVDYEPYSLVHLTEAGMHIGRDIAHRHTDFLRVVVKHRQRPEALALERRIFCNRAADIARAHDNLRMLTVKSQNFANVHFQIRHLIPVPLTSEAAEAVDVLPNLRRREVHPLAQLLRRNLLHTCAFQFPQMPIISRQPTDYRVRHMPCHPHSPPVHLLSWGISAQFLHVKGISI